MIIKRKKPLIAVLVLLIAVIFGAVLFYYMNAYYLRINGDENITVGLNAVYEDPGAEAKKGGRDISDDIDVSGEVDTSVPGKYKLEYSAGNLTAERTVTVLDEMNPVIELSGDETLTIKLGESYSEPGYTATDENGSDITDSVTVSDTEFNKAGKQQIEYVAKDGSGRKTRVTRTVNVEANTEYDAAGLPICMYHYVYDENNPPDDLNQRFGNYISTQALEEELDWLNEEGYYYPTWQEVRAYIDGELLLPDKSIVLTFDDGARTFLENGIPVLEKCKVPATCFMITSSDGKNKIAEFKSDYVTYESHSDNLHRAGGNIGHGGIFTVISREEGLADLKKSIEICGNGDAFAYPYGDYNDSCEEMVKEAGFLCAVTTQAGKVYPGDNPLLLPRVRMSLGQSLEGFQGMVSP